MQISDSLDQTSPMFRLLVEAVKDYAIFMLNPQGYILTWNKGAHRLKGYEAKEVIGTHFSRFYTSSDIKRNHPQYELDQAIKNGSYEEEGWRVRKDGEQFWASVTITAVRDEAGVLMGFAKVTRDLTEKKIAEDDLRQAYEGLEERVKQRTAELAHAKEEAEKAVRARDEFLSIASHELKTPMTSLKLQIQMRKRNLEKENLAMFAPDRLRQMFEDDSRQVNRIGRLIDDMLDITRLTSGRFNLAKERVDLRDLIQDVMNRFTPQLEAHGIEVKIKAPEEIIGFWDQYRIEQVFINLLTNAIRYGNNKPIHISLSKDAVNAKFIVKDFGIGISPEDQKRIFQQFERVTTTHSTNGLGLGLYIVNQIIEAHGGHITLESELGKGSAFAVSLPLTSK